MKDKSLAVMQPYFLPYLGYFSLIRSVDHFVFFDDVQYQRKSWMSRNRLQNIEKGIPFYIRPDIIKPKYKEYLPSVCLDNQSNWKNKLREQMVGYKAKVGFYNEAVEVLDAVLKIESEKLVDFNIESTKLISQFLGLETEFSKFSDYNFWFERKPTAATWGFEIAKSFCAKQYINAPGGEDFIFPDTFSESKIKLGFIQPELGENYSNINKFIPGLSIIDVIAFFGLNRTREITDNYKIKWKN